MNPAHLIPAFVWTDDQADKAAFDAAPWFAQATPQEIADLAACGWRGDYPADAVAEWTRESDPSVSAVIAYAERATGAGEECGFECAIDETAARAWLAAHRPDVLAELKATP